MTIPTLTDLPADVQALLADQQYRDAFITWFDRIADGDPVKWQAALLKIKWEVDSPAWRHLWVRDDEHLLQAIRGLRPAPLHSGDDGKNAVEG